jgi:hypothetical protein
MTSPHFGSDFLRLAEAGYTPNVISLLPLDAKLSPRSKIKPEQLGKIPGLLRPDGYCIGFPKWTAHFSTPEEIKVCSTWKPAFGVGMIGRIHPGLDLDSTDEKLSVAWKNLAFDTLGETAVRIGAAPKALLVYGSTERLHKCRLVFAHKRDIDEDGKVKDGAELQALELLGFRQQYAVHAVHPKTRQPYTWPNGDLVAWKDKIPTHGAAPFGAYLSEAIKVAEQVGYVLVDSAHGRDRVKQEGVDVALDLPRNVAHATAYVKKQIEKHGPLVEGGGSDDRVYKMMAMMLDFGLSDVKIIESIANVAPDFDTDWLEDKLANACAYKQNANCCYADEPLEKRFAECIAQMKAGAADEINMDGDGPEWPDDVADPLIDDTDDAPVFTRNMAPTVITDRAFDLADLMGASPGMCALPLIVIAAAALGNEHTIQPTPDFDYVERPTLWGATVAKPGQVKSPILKSALQALDPIAAEWRREDDVKWARYKTAETLYQKQMSDWKKDHSSFGDPLRAGEGRPMPVEPVKPAYRKLTFGDATLERVGELLRDNPRGMLAVYDELTSMLGGFDSYRGGSNRGGRTKVSKDRSAFLSAHSGIENHTVDRKSGDIIIPRWQFSVLGNLTTHKLAKLAADGALSDDGLLQRFIFGLRGDDAPEKVYRAPDDLAGPTYKQTVYALAHVTPRNTPIVFSPEAFEIYKRWERYTSGIGDYQVNATDAFIEWAAKGGATFARLALVFHALEHVSKPHDHTLPPIISGETAEMVFQYLRHYQIPVASKVFQDLGASRSELNTTVLRIAATILAQGYDKLTFRTIYRAHHDLKAQPDLIRKAMGVLGTFGWVLEDGNRFRLRGWLVNPLVHERLAERATQIRERNAKAAARAAEWMEMRRQEKTQQRAGENL